MAKKKPKLTGKTKSAGKAGKSRSKQIAANDESIQQIIQERNGLRDEVDRLNSTIDDLQERLAEAQSKCSEMTESQHESLLQQQANDLTVFDVVACFGRITDNTNEPHKDQYFMQLVNGDPSNPQASGFARQAVMLAHAIKEQMALYQQEMAARAEQDRQLQEAEANGTANLREDGQENSPQLA